MSNHLPNEVYPRMKDILTFLPHLDVLADSNVFAPRLLDDPSITVVLPLPHLL